MEASVIFESVFIQSKFTTVDRFWVPCTRNHSACPRSVNGFCSVRVDNLWAIAKPEHCFVSVSYISFYAAVINHGHHA